MPLLRFWLALLRLILMPLWLIRLPIYPVLRNLTSHSISSLVT